MPRLWIPAPRAPQMEELNMRLYFRDALLNKLCHDDTISLDLIAEYVKPNMFGQATIEARVSQKFRADPKGQKCLELYSPVFILDGSLIQTYAKENLELVGK